MRTHVEPDLDWNLVRSFVAVVEAGSLNAAARQLQLSHPTVARHIQSLEEQLGLQLFDRTSHGLVITPQGQSLATQALAMQREATAFGRLTDSVRAKPLPLMRITAAEIMGDVLANLLPPMLETLAEENAPTQTPTVELILSNEQLNLLEREADVAVRHVQPEQQDLICRKLGSLPMLICASRTYLQKYGEVTLNNLEQHRFIDDAGDGNFQKGAARQDIHIPDSAFTLRTNSIRTQTELMRCGGGIAALPVPLVRDLDDVTPVFGEADNVTLDVWLVARPELRNNNFAFNLFRRLADGLNEALTQPRLYA